MYGDPFFLHTNKMLILLQKEGHLVSRTKTQSTALKGGYWNVLMRVQAPKKDMVVKQFDTSHNNPMFPNLPNAEALALQVLSPLGVSPSYIDFLPDVEGGPVLVYGYVEGDMWRNNCAAVGRLLRKLHKADIQEDFRSLNVEPADILAQADETLDALPIDTPGLAELRISRPEPFPHPGLIQRSLVHTDTGPGNMIDGPNGLVLIDWQCPGMGDPVEDLVCFVSPGMQILYGCEPLSEGDVETVLDCYDDPVVVERFHALRKFYHYRYLSYYLMRSLRLRDEKPDAADRYFRAFVAELDMLKGLPA